MVPNARVFAKNLTPVRPEREYVLYWMMAYRRTTWNFALSRAIEIAEELGKPLVIFEPLRAGYRWASPRHHQFIMQGMRERARALEASCVTYLPYVEPAIDEGKGLLDHLAARACAVVTDDYPAFFVPRAIQAAASRLDVRLEAVDSNGIFPMRATDRVFTTAHSFRAFLQKTLPEHLAAPPAAAPLENLDLPVLSRAPLSDSARWRTWDPNADFTAALDALPIDHEVGVVRESGGCGAASDVLDRFMRVRLQRYGAGRNDPENEAASGLSPYLHFGMVSAHEVMHAVLKDSDWDLGRLGADTRGARAGWWGVPEYAERFLDELVTWRELGFNMCAQRPDDYDSFESLPAWSKQTLRTHVGDERPYIYTRDVLERAETHDEIWNAAQRQLRTEGRMHNYLRMLWGKKVLEWSRTPEDALDTLREINNRWALDGRDPNSYSGIFWTLGRYDRAWGPERPIFGKVRYMSSDATRRKLPLKGYLARYGAAGQAVQGSLNLG